MKFALKFNHAESIKGSANPVNVNHSHLFRLEKIC